jgi:hypothetical protein
MQYRGIGGNIQYDPSMWAIYPNTDVNPRMTHAFSDFAENRTMADGGKMWAIDNDGVVRRGDGWRQKGTAYNLFNSKVNAQLQYAINGPSLCRPRRLDRPFKSVAELGYVLRDDPWKTLNFFWSDSADSGLLDFFCVEEPRSGLEVRGGTVNLNRAPTAVLGALLSGTKLNAQRNDKTIENVDSREPDGDLQIDANSDGKKLAQDIRNYLGDRYKPQNVIRNVADLVPLTEKLIGENENIGNFGLYKWRQEAVARSLADVCNTRTWNLFVDVVAQDGGFTPDSENAEDFLVRGERRLWMHVAIDRFTGEIVGTDVERVFE